MSSPIKSFLIIFMLYTPVFSVCSQQLDRASWMKEVKWGIMTHYLADWIAESSKVEMTKEKWNELVDQFNVKGLAQQLNLLGAGYYIITAGQNSGYYLSPNKSYDAFTKTGKCSKRDLIAELAIELRRYHIRLIVYLPAGAPNSDHVAKRALQWQNGPHPNKEFQLMWEQVIREWSLRWGRNIDGWWFDGCYWPNVMYRSESGPNFASFAAAARAGNPNSIVAFNPGVVNRTISITPHEDYIAGEISEPDLMSIKRVYEGKVDGSQLHILSYLGEKWGMGSARFQHEQVIQWSKKVIENGGAITWDVPVQPDGLISKSFIDQLTVVSKGIK